MVAMSGVRVGVRRYQEDIYALQNSLDAAKEDLRTSFRDSIHQACYDTAAYIADAIGKLGPFRIIYNGHGGIPALSWTLKDGIDPGFNKELAADFKSLGLGDMLH